MIHSALIRPSSIAVVGASNDTTKPGGKVLKNLLDGGGMAGGGLAGRPGATAPSGHPPGQLSIYPVNPREDRVQGIPAYSSVQELPTTDLAILAIPAIHCGPAMQTLAAEKQTRGFIVLSAGFSEEGAAGAELERQLAEIADRHGASLIGPNCIGLLTPHYNGVFTTPIPRLVPGGCDLISGSGATAVFIMESGLTKGLTFSRVFSVGNGAQNGVEEVLEYLDLTWSPDSPDSRSPKLLYIEGIRDPRKLLHHARSLVEKGCPVAAVKAGSSDAGSRAATSHTGALADSDVAVDALFRKAGIVRCYSREELTTMAAVFSLPRPRGKRIAVITHAGGPAVMLTDALSTGGLEVPQLSGPAADRLKERLFPGSSVANPIDFLATGTAEQLGTIIDACETDFDTVDAMVVIFGSPGLVPVDRAYDVLSDRMNRCTKPIYPVLPSVVNAAGEMERFVQKGYPFFPDEVALGRALAAVTAAVATVPTEAAATTALPNQETAPASSPPPLPDRAPEPARERLLSILGGKPEPGAYLPPEKVRALLDAAGIPGIPETVAATEGEARAAAAELGYPVVMKVVGPIHKSDVGGVITDIHTDDAVAESFTRIMAIDGAESVLLQPMITGPELFAGATSEGEYGHLLVTGLGGIFVEVLRDVRHALAPVTFTEALQMIRSLRSYPLIQGIRGRSGADENAFAAILVALSDLVTALPEIAEMDLNPLIADERSGGTRIVAVDARIRLSAEPAGPGEVAASPDHGGPG
jgi:acetate---CoA ligase (ADP-forming)